MSSPHPHTKLTRGRQAGIAAPAVQAQDPHGPQFAGGLPRRRVTSRRRLGVAIAVAAGIAGGSSALAIAGHTADATTHSLSIGPSAQAPRIGATSSLFVSRMRELEARGYVEVLCEVGGDLMFNPRTHRYVRARA